MYKEILADSSLKNSANRKFIHLKYGESKELKCCFSILMKKYFKLINYYIK